MKTLLIMLMLSPLVLLSQTKKMSERIQAIDFSKSAPELKTKATKAGLSWECCIEEKCPCTDLKDPWEEDSALTHQQQMSKIKSDPKAAQVQKDMVNFEQAILYGKGKKMIDKSVVANAFKKYPGYSLKAIKNRMDIYILSLESETEDE